jgi:hypothetical protein
LSCDENCNQKSWKKPISEAVDDRSGSESMGDGEGPSILPNKEWKTKWEKKMRK